MTTYVPYRYAKALPPARLVMLVAYLTKNTSSSSHVWGLGPNLHQTRSCFGTPDYAIPGQPDQRQLRRLREIGRKSPLVHAQQAVNVLTGSLTPPNPFTRLILNQSHHFNQLAVYILLRFVLSFFTSVKIMKIRVSSDHAIDWILKETSGKFDCVVHEIIVHCETLESTQC